MMMLNHVETIGHPFGETLKGLDQDRLDLAWQTSLNTEDSGVYTIGCMETFMGDLKSWKRGFDLNSSKRQIQINDLRAKYVSTLILSPLNERKVDATNKYTKYFTIPDAIRSEMLEQAHLIRWQRLNPCEEKYG